VGVQTWRRRSGLTEKAAVRGSDSSPLQQGVRQAADVSADPRTTRVVWEGIYGHPLSDDDLTEVEGNLFRFIDLLASINGSILGARELSTTDGDEAA
jgi:hypothetical protein